MSFPGQEAVGREEAGPRAGFAALFVSCSLWGAAFPFARLALLELPVSHVILLRFAVASAALLPIVVRRWDWPRTRNLPRYLLAGFLAIPVTYLLQFNGLALTTISRASLILGALPPLVALASTFFLREPGSVRYWLGIGISALGILMIVGLPSGGGSWKGDGLVFLSTLASTAWILMSQRLSREDGPLTAAAFVLLFGTLILAPIALAWDGLPEVHLSGAAWGSILTLGLLCTVLTFLLWNWGVEQVGAGRAGVFLNLEPLVGALLGVALWGEPFGLGLLLGGALVLVAAVYVNQPQTGVSGAKSRPARLLLGSSKWRHHREGKRSIPESREHRGEAPAGGHTLVPVRQSDTSITCPWGHGPIAQGVPQGSGIQPGA